MTKVLTYIEIDVPFCANTYGVAPCTASLTSSPPTGTRKCFNTPNTCQDRVNYIDAPVTLRFSSDVGFLPDDIDVIPNVLSISYTPGTLSLGKDLGTRSTLSVNFADHPWPDTAPGFDKYRTERPYDPMKLGTFWGKFRARQPFLRGRPMRLIRGEVGQTLAEMETRHYIIDSFSHNADDGTYTIVAKDALKLADNDRAQAPILSQGFLVADITNTAASFTLSPSGIGNDEYPTSGYLAIGGKEVVSFFRDQTAGNDANTHFYAHLQEAALPEIDYAASPKTISNSGSVVPTVNSLLFNGGFLFLADHADWTPSGNFTIECRVRFGSLATVQPIFCHFTDANNQYFLRANTNGSLTFSVISAGVTIVTMSSSSGAVIALGAGHYHIAVIRTSNVWKIAKDGVQVATTTDSDAIPNFTSQFRIGADTANIISSSSSMFEFRFSHVARFVTPFTPNPVGMFYQTSSDIIQVVARGQLNTDAISHEAQDRVQVVLSYAAQDAADIIRDLLVNYAGISDSYIPIDSWRTETASFLNRVFTADIAEPTGVQTLINELIEEAALSLWWDDVTPEMRLRVLRPIAADAFVFDQDNYMEGTFKSREQPSERISEVWRYFAKRNPLERNDNTDNYRSVAVVVDLQAETDYGSSAIKKIYSRWTPFGGRSIADKANQIYLSRYRDPPRKFNFSVFRNDLIIPELGQGYRVAGMGLQDDTGAPTNTPIQISRLIPSDSKFDIEAQEMLQASNADDLINRVIVIDGNVNNVNLKTLHDSLYPEATAQDVIDGVNLTCYVEAGVTIGSILSFSALTSFIVDAWPTGFPITLVVDGKILGHGGIGATAGVAGSPGGTAIYTRHPITLEYTGIIRAGGGGGGAGATKFTSASGGRYWVSCGGGGGAGYTPGQGGSGFTNPDTGYVPPKGANGTETAGGAGGDGGSSLTNPGGNGGNPGVAGSSGSSSNGGPTTVINATAGGAAGNAIDGISFVTVTVSTGTLTGPTVN